MSSTEGDFKVVFAKVVFAKVEEANPVEDALELRRTTDDFTRTEEEDIVKAVDLALGKDTVG